MDILISLGAGFIGGLLAPRVRQVWLRHVYSRKLPKAATLLTDQDWSAGWHIESAARITQS